MITYAVTQSNSLLELTFKHRYTCVHVLQCPEVRLNIISSLESVNKGKKKEEFYMYSIHVCVVVVQTLINYYMYMYVCILCL